MPAIRPMAAALAVFSLIALSGCGGANARYASHLERGKQYLSEGNLDKASVEFRNALQVRPKDATALFLNGTVAERRGSMRDAAALYQAAVDIDPEYDDARAGLGKLYLFGGAPERAMELIKPGLVKHPDNADLLLVRAAAEQLLKNDAAARTDAERAVKLAPKNSNAISVLASVYSKAGDNERAISLVHDAVTQQPSSIDLRQVLTTLYLKTAQDDLAAGEMRKVIDIDPKALTSRLQLAYHYARVRKPDEAQGVLEQAVKAMPDNDEAKLALVNFIAAQRSRAQGEKILRDFIAKEPENYELRFGLGSLLQRSGAQPEALAVYDEVIKLNGTGPSGLQARDRIAAIRVSQGRYDDALKLVNEVLQKSARDNDALSLRANIALERQDPRSAIADLRAVLRDQPNAVPLQRTLARAHLANGEPALAEEALRAAMESSPDDAALRIDLAQLLLQTRRVDLGVTMLEETVRRAPTNAFAREALVRAYLMKQDLPAAHRAAEDLKTLDPKASVGFYLAGLVAQGEKRLDDSQRELEHALELQPGATDVLTSLTRLDLAQNRSAAAIARLKSAYERSPKNTLLLNLLGEVYLATRDFANATQTFAQVTTINPKWWVPYRNLALVKVAANDTSGAVAAYENALKVAPQEPQLNVETALLYEKQGRIDDAIARYNALYKSEPSVQQLAANNLAMLLVTYKKDQPSLDRARDLTASFASSENGAFLDTHGWVRFKRGEITEALPVLERAASRAPDSKVIRYHLAMAELQAGQKDRARANLEAALAGSPNFVGADDAHLALASLKKTG